jgi:hypothetical protein
MKSYILLIFLFLSIQINKGWSQNINLDYKHALKVYNLSTFDDYNKTNEDTFGLKSTTISLTQILHPTIAFQWKTKKNNFQEIELTNFTFNVAGTKTELINMYTGKAQLQSNSCNLTQTYISLRYEYIKNFNKSKDKKLVPSLGLSLSPYFKRNMIKPLKSDEYMTGDQILGCRGFIIPRLNYYISPKLFIDFDIPLCIFDFYYITEVNKNPSLSLLEQRHSSSNSKVTPGIFSARIGIGLKI